MTVTDIELIELIDLESDIECNYNEKTCEDDVKWSCEQPCGCFTYYWCDRHKGIFEIWRKAFPIMECKTCKTLLELRRMIIRPI